MPRALDPNARFPIVLKSDRNRPEPRPTFWARYLTGREWIALSEAQNTGEHKLASWYNVLRLCVVDWQHVTDAAGNEIRFAPASFENILDPGEARELVEACAAGQQPDADEKKDSGSPPQSRPASSVRPADQANAGRTPSTRPPGPGSNAPTVPAEAAPNAMKPAGMS